MSDELQLPRAISVFVSFVALMRINGFAVAPEQTTAFLAAIELLGPRSLEAIRLAGLATLAPPPERRATAQALAARFPEHEEYVISTSEFQRVKARLLRLSNARASTAGALPGAEEGPPGRPTLKRRQPTPDDSTTNPDGTGIETKPADKQEAPKLKKDPSKPSQP